MNPGAAEEAAKTANTFMEVMRSQPIALALVVMNLCLLAFLYYFALSAKEERQRELELLYTNRSEVAQLLSRCVDPDVLIKQLEVTRQISERNAQQLQFNRQEMDQILQILKKPIEQR